MKFKEIIYVTIITLTIIFFLINLLFFGIYLLDIVVVGSVIGWFSYRLYKSKNIDEHSSG